MQDVTHPDDWDREQPSIEESLAGQRPVRGYMVEKRYLRKDGASRWVRVYGDVLHLQEGEAPLAVASVEDITEQRELEEQFRQAQKMEAVGRLAGGVAHDFNNLLGPILGYTAMLMDDLPEQSPMRPDLQAIMDSGRRARDLVRQLLAFSRAQDLKSQPLDLNRLVNGLKSLIRKTLREDIELSIHTAPEPVVVDADLGRMEQVILNLVVNAQDAMPLGGALTIRTGRTDLRDPVAAGRCGMDPGLYALLDVIDTGQGMERETLDRIFEPFFTTKEVGKGTGLGLATVFGLVRKHGGNIQVDSTPSLGTVFHILLPLGRMTETAPREQAAHDPVQNTGRGLVLVVEDNHTMRRMTCKMLERLGYETLSAEGPHHAPVHGCGHARNERAGFRGLRTGNASGHARRVYVRLRRRHCVTARLTRARFHSKTLYHNRNTGQDCQRS